MGIDKLKREAAALAGGQMIWGATRDCSPEIEEAFWRHVVALETAKEIPLFERLLQAGVSLPPPGDLDDHAVTAKLWEVIRALARLHTYLCSTDHLSDRELYAYLWEQALREPDVVLPDDLPAACYIDLVGGGSTEDVLVYLRYYADEDDRRWWVREWPWEAIPAHEEPPFARDRHLPRPAI